MATVDYKRLKPTCSCSSYAFPHRAGGGRCECECTWKRAAYHLVPGDRGPNRWEVTPLCAMCGQPAECVQRDFGIGAYEYWGSPGVDVNLQLVTECCEANEVSNTWSERLKHKWDIVK